MNKNTQPETISTARAAAILNLSRSQLLLLLEAGTIKASRAARHFRVDASDLQRYQESRRAERSAALDELAAADADSLR